MKKTIKLLTLVLLICSFNTMKVEAVANPTRIFGNDRVETSVEVSKKAYTNANTVIIAGFGGQVDSLSGTILAHFKDAPMILTRKDKLDDIALKELERLKPSQVYILGGETVVSKAVEDSLSAYKVTRLRGDRREETAINIAKEVVGEKTDDVFLTLGYEDYADALAIGPVSAVQKKPIFLTKSNIITKDTKDALISFGVKRVTIIGGEQVINKSVENELKAMNISVNRVFGNNRMETSINIAKEYSKTPSSFIIANGYKYADAVIGGYFAVKQNAPILLSKDKVIDIKTLDYINTNKINTFILGGESVITKRVYDDLNFMLNGTVVIKDIVTQFTEPFSITEIKDSALPAGEKVVKQKGINGVREVTDRVYYKNNEQFRIENILNILTKSPVQEIVLVGTKK